MMKNHGESQHGNAGFFRVYKLHKIFLINCTFTSLWACFFSCVI